MLTAISPVDGRYAAKTQPLSDFFSEFALIRYRTLVEIQYFIALAKIPLPQLAGFPQEKIHELERLTNRFDLQDAEVIKRIEQETNHDVKAVEYWLKQQFEQLGIGAFREFIHFGLTSQDINNTAIPLMLKHATEQILLPLLEQLADALQHPAEAWKAIPMLARTHGQPASPTTVGKEMLVFTVRLREQIKALRGATYRAKFGGATGNFNAHYVAYPTIDWKNFAEAFIGEVLGLERSYPTTQIDHYDQLAALFQTLKRINTVLIDLCRDIWTYISMEYFGQKVIAQEVGSSAMPHKVNPIDFENAEGNLGLANAVATHLADKLPVSRLQRDLTDSTVLRNIGMPYAHSLISYQAILKGLSKITLNGAVIERDLENHWIVVSEAIQNILRREGYNQPYEALKALTRGKGQIGKAEIHAFIDGLDVREQVKAEMKKITPWNYIGVP